jgi:hypothetical protein
LKLSDWTRSKPTFTGRSIPGIIIGKPDAVTGVEDLAVAEPVETTTTGTTAGELGALHTVSIGLLTFQPCNKG